MYWMFKSLVEKYYFQQFRSSEQHAENLLNLLKYCFPTRIIELKCWYQNFPWKITSVHFYIFVVVKIWPKMTNDTITDKLQIDVAIKSKTITFQTGYCWFISQICQPAPVAKKRNLTLGNQTRANFQFKTRHWHIQQLWGDLTASTNECRT